MTYNRLVLLLVILFSSLTCAQSPDGYDLWLGYSKVEDVLLAQEYSNATKSIYFLEESEMSIVTKKELKRGLEKLLGQSPDISNLQGSGTTLLISKKDNLPQTVLQFLDENLEQVGKEGFVLKEILSDGKEMLVLSANNDQGILYGVFRLLSLMQQGETLEKLDIVDAPKIDLRVLNHWDNLDRTVERGYAGFSLWNWQKLPEYIDPRYIDYARANASVGINGTAVSNVNANSLILTPMYLEKVKALADTFRPYGIKVYLTARFSSPIEIGGLETADPLDANVQEWWRKKTDQIYALIPDFGGYLVKANSEGQPGPQNYGRTHVDGANMMAKVLEPHGGIVMWRAFVYSEHDKNDRAKQAYSEFVPFDGKFMDNVLVQSKNGAIDFQPREPFHPMFGAMPQTNLMMEFQITKEYLGFSTHLVYLPKLFEEVLDADTFQKGKGSTVAKVVDGTLHGTKLTGIAGVANTGTDLNWTGHTFAQADWYGFGRLAWNPYLGAEKIADEWIKATYSRNQKFVEPIKKMMLGSREAVVNYMNPLGLHHIFDTGHHYGPGPWVSELSRPEWNPTYYHKADENGIGFDRTSTGSDAASQYAPELAKIFNDPKTTPEELLLWFHHLPWDYELKNGLTLWNGMALKYQEGVDQVKEMIETWEKSKPYISKEQFEEIQMSLNIQLKEAKWWRDACLLYFQTFSKQKLPQGVEKPTKTLEYFKSLKFPFAPGRRPQWD